MVQSTRNAPLDKRVRGIYTQYDKNLNVSTTASFVNQLVIDATPLRESVIIIHNNGAGDVDYEIVGTAEHPDDIVLPTGTNDDDKGWVVLLNGTGSIATGVVPLKQSFTNPWTQVVVKIKHTTTTTTVDIWSRGEN